METKKTRREVRQERREKKWRRSGKIIKHHICNRCQGGKSTPENLLLFDSRREQAWHFLFGNKDFDEVIELLKRCKRMKERKR